MQESQYTILQVIGQGSYGKVYKAIHRQSATPVAIKVLACSEQSNEKVANELQIMMDCNNDHVVRCFGCQIAPSGVWIVMEYCQHGSVADLLRKSVRLSQYDIASIIQSILKGLDYLHSKKKIHRDVKAANVLLDQKGVAKLADFGVAAQLLHTFADKETIIGSPFWMSPQILSKCKYNFKTDIWSLGITAIQLAQGQPPFSNLHPFRAMFQIKQTPPKGLSSPELYSPQFNNFVRKCLTYNPDQRPSARQLLLDPFIKLRSRGRLNTEVLERARFFSKTKQTKKDEFLKNDSGTIIQHISGDFSQGEIVWDKPEAGTIVLKDQIPLKQQQPDFIKYIKDNSVKPRPSFRQKQNQPVSNVSIVRQSVSELQAKLVNLTRQMQTQISQIKQKYRERLNELRNRLEQSRQSKKIQSRPKSGLSRPSKLKK